MKGGTKWWAIIWLFGCMWLTSQTTSAQVTYINSDRRGNFDNLGSVAPLQFTYTVGSGTNRVIYVGVSTYSINGFPLAQARVLNVTFDNGTTIQSFTPVGSQSCPGALLTRCSMQLFRLNEAQINNAVSGNITVTFNIVSGFFINYAVAGAITLGGVNQMMPDENFNSTSGNASTASVTVSGVAVGDLVLDTIGTTFDAGEATTNTTNQIERWNGRGAFPNSLLSIGAGSTKAGSGPVTMGWDLDAVQDWALGAIVVNSAAGGTSASVSISGQVRGGKGLRGVPKATVYLTDADGTTRSAITNSFGYYRFQDVAAGASYTVNVLSKRYQFQPRVVTINEAIVNLDFTAEP